MPIRVITMAIRAITMGRSWRSRWADLRDHDRAVPHPGAKPPSANGARNPSADFGPRMADRRPRNPDLGSRDAELGPRTSERGRSSDCDCGSWTSELGPRTADLGRRDSGIPAERTRPCANLPPTSAQRPRSAYLDATIRPIRKREASASPQSPRAASREDGSFRDVPTNSEVAQSVPARAATDLRGPSEESTIPRTTARSSTRRARARARERPRACVRC